jgi:hypothetical protein
MIVQRSQIFYFAAPTSTASAWSLDILVLALNSATGGLPEELIRAANWTDVQRQTVEHDLMRAKLISGLSHASTTSLCRFK